MTVLKINHLDFSYPASKQKHDQKTLSDICLDFKAGSFSVLCGQSGSGKTTLLRLLKPGLQPQGRINGQILYRRIEDENQEFSTIESLDEAEAASEIGFVFQNPDSQLVTDKVWHELVFGLESMGLSQHEMRLRAAETASFFGITSWFYRDVNTLSGGEKQLLNLASVMAMHPRIVLLDEPTAQLDPIGAGNLLYALNKVNKELGVTIILSEHRLEEALPYADRMILLDGGRVIVDEIPGKVGAYLLRNNHAMFESMPVPMKVAGAFYENPRELPVTVNESFPWMDQVFGGISKDSAEEIFREEPDDLENCSPETGEISILEAKGVFFRYEKDGEDVLNNMNLSVRQGEILSILGANGSGKSTAVSVLSGIKKPFRGKVLFRGKEIFSRKGNIPVSVLPQNPQGLFLKKTVKEDLMSLPNKTNQRIMDVVTLCELEDILERHPYDLSGGEQQRLALAKILLSEPEILFLDEPTKGFDGFFKRQFGAILQTLKRQGKTIIMVTHDIEFSASFSDRCAMFFNGSIATIATPKKFFQNNQFYTTAASRMMRHISRDIVTVEEGIAFVRRIKKPEEISPVFETEKNRLPIKEIERNEFIPFLQKIENDRCVSQNKEPKRRYSAAIWLMVALLAIPATIFIGIYAFEDRAYHAISFAILAEIFLAFIVSFEGRKPTSREVVLIASLCAVGSLGRIILYIVPQVKLVCALVIIIGVCLGYGTGFIAGAVIAFISNFFFGQGPWTPWQMMAFGLVGFFAGLLAKGRLLPKKRIPLSIFGLAATVFIYGGIMNPASVLMFQPQPTWQMVVLSYLQGLPFDLIHGISTAIFLFLLAEPLMERLERVIVKYGIRMW